MVRRTVVLLLSPIVCVMGGVGVVMAVRLVAGRWSPAMPRFNRGRCGCQDALGEKGALLSPGSAG